MPEISHTHCHMTPSAATSRQVQLQAVMLARPDHEGAHAGMVVLMADARMEPAVAKDMLQVGFWTMQP